MANAWYAYIGGTAGDPTLAKNYIKIIGKPGCLSGAFVCAIYAPGGGIFPIAPLSTHILEYIGSGLSNLVPQPQEPAGTKFFVYMKATA